MRITAVVCLSLSVLLSASASGAQEYQIDDGSGPLSTGGAANDIFWGNTFEVDPSCNVITGLSVAFGFDNQSTALVGDDVVWRIFGDDDNDPTNGVMTLLASGDHIVLNNAQTLVLDEIAVDSVSVADFNYFFVALSMNFRFVSFPAVQDIGTTANASYIRAGIFLDPLDWSAASPPASVGDFLIRASAVASVMPGDINCDGIVDLLDVAPFVDALLNDSFDAKADLNQDGQDDLLDVSLFIDLLL